jgi:hypothetical protein
MYTLELYKTDARTKSGERLVEKRDGCGAMGSPLRAVELHYAKMYPAPKWRVEIHETMVTKRNVMNGAEFKERYDTPYYCSPSSETYWSM